MDASKALKKGKSEMRLISAGLGGLSLALAASEIFLYQNLILLIVSQVLLTGLVALLLASAAGRPVRWTLFIVLFLSGMLAFYLGGSRMALHKTPQMTWDVLLAVGTALAYLLAALYIAYSPEIGVYLQRKKKSDPLA